MPRLTQLDRFWQIHRIGRTNRNPIPQRTPERSGEQYQSDKTKVYPRAGGGTLLHITCERMNFGLSLRGWGNRGRLSATGGNCQCRWPGGLNKHKQTREANMARIGYASGTVQEIKTQIATLREAGCGMVQAEEQDGASALDALFDYTIGADGRVGDVLVVTQFYRLAQSMADLQVIVQRLDERGAFLATADGRVDTSKPDNRERMHKLFRAILDMQADA